VYQPPGGLHTAATAPCCCNLGVSMLLLHAADMVAAGPGFKPQAYLDLFSPLSCQQYQQGCLPSPPPACMLRFTMGLPMNTSLARGVLPQHSILLACCRVVCMQHTLHSAALLSCPLLG
jgi:hypothetical protein